MKNRKMSRPLASWGSERICHPRTLAMCSVATLLAAIFQPAFSQETSPGEATEESPSAAAEPVPEDTTETQSVSNTTESDSDAIAEIVVTAQRRAQSLQDVPISVTAFSDEMIERARIQKMSDVVSRTPGLSFDAFPASQPRPFIRGIGSSDTGAAGDPSSAVFVDEVYLGRPAAVAFDAFDIERIEVLKGPQGTLYGRNVVGGAISVITKRPELGEFSARGEMTAGSYDTLEGAAVVNAPIADRTAMRLSASVRTHDGYVRNDYTGGKLDDKNTKSGRYQIYSELSDQLSTLFTLDGTRDRANGPATYVFARDPDSALGPLWTPNPDRDSSAPEIDGHQNRDTWGIRNGTDYELSFGTLSFIGSYRDLKYRSYYDSDGGNPTTQRFGAFLGFDEDTDFWSTELRLSSLPESKTSWVVGLYKFNQEVVRDTILDLTTTIPLPAPFPAPGATSRDIFAQNAKLDSFAAFGDTTVPLSERIRAYGGLRYTDDKKDYRVSNEDSTALIRARERFDVSDSASFSAVTYRAGLDFRPVESQLLYGQIARGFKSGGFQDNPGNAAAAATAFKPEYATQYELGQKGEFFGRRLIWNNTVYYIDYQDLQTRRVNDDLSITVDNAGKATIKGVETQSIISLFHGFRLDLSYAYTDAKFDQYRDGEEDFSGNRISRTPEHKFIASPSYQFPSVSGFDINASAEYRYESKIFDDNSNNDLEVRPATNFVDARIVISPESEAWTLTFWGKNLTNEKTRSFQTVALGALTGSLLDPRVVGATVGVKF